MSLSVILACLWVVAASVVALLPWRAQFPPGIALLILAPGLIGFLGWEHGIWVAALALAAFASMFRNPLRYLIRRMFGRVGDDEGRP